MRSLCNLRQKLFRFSKVCGDQGRMISRGLSHETAPFVGMLKRNTSEPLLLASYSTSHGCVLRCPSHLLYFNINATVELPNLHVPLLPLIGKIIGDEPLDENIIGHIPRVGDIIGYRPSDEKVIGYIPKVHSDVHCSSVLKKRKTKMNKHKLRKRRKRDRFKRRALKNLRERKKRVKEKAKERALKQAGA